MGNRRPLALFLTTPAWRAILEAAALADLAMVGLMSLGQHFRPQALRQGALFFGGGAALWCALRTKFPTERPWHRQLVCEVLAACALSVMLAGGLGLALRYGWATVSPESNSGVVLLLLFASGGESLVVRVGIALWQHWTRLRRRRLLWDLIHLQVQVVLLFAGLLGVLFVVTLFVEGYLPPGTPDRSGVVSLLDALIFTILPFAGVALVATLVVLAAVLPPTALFAYFVSRRTTHRLEDLTQAAARLRAGDFQARVAVRGEDEIAQLQADFNAMAEGLGKAMRDLQGERDRVADLMQSRRELVASVSHELRTPVATVRGYLESIQTASADGPADEWKHDMQIVHNEVLRLQGLIDDLFTLSRADAGGLRLDIRPTDVGALVQRRVEAAAPMARRSGRVEVIDQAPATLPLALADEQRLDQVLSNLLRNAVQHTLPGGLVAVNVQVEGNVLRIDVRDTGEGITEEDLPRIWERFYRGAHTQHLESTGTGLGLALVKELTEAMGGTVAVQSAPGAGSCFTVRLPLA